MSLESTGTPDSSATKTNTTDENAARARDPKDTGVIDAEFSEEPKQEAPKGPRVARVADVTPLRADEVFGGNVKDTANASAPRGARSAPGEAPKRGRKPKAAPEPAQTVTDKHLDTAKGMLQTFDMLFRMQVRSNFEDFLTAENLAALDQKVKLQEEQVEGMAAPLAVGLAENGVELPWWAQFGLAGLGAYGGKLVMLQKLKKRCEEESAKAPGAAPTAAAS